MQEITKLNVTRQQLAEKQFYYNGCETNDINTSENENNILDIAVDVLIAILVFEYKNNF